MVVPPSELQIWERAPLRKMKVSGDSFEVKKSYEVLTNAAEWLIRKGKLKKSDCPIPIGRKRHLIHIEPKHGCRDDFRAPKKLSNNLYIETHWSTVGCINNARRLLGRFGYRGDTLQVY
ncbi:MAG: hypothetical protein QXL67_05380 [Candidatus Bathyarchaeia archaeon]